MPATRPITNDPKTLINSVPHGNRGPVSAVMAPVSQNRATLPMAPPTATAIQAPIDATTFYVAGTLTSAVLLEQPPGPGSRNGCRRIAAMHSMHGLISGNHIITRLIISLGSWAFALAEFHRDLLFLLHDVARLLRVDADKRARLHGMTRAQWGILIWLDRQPGISQKELSELLEVEPISVARLIDRLEARGMVERRPDPRDRRIWRLHLLRPARDVLHEIDDQRADMTRMVTAGIDEDSIETMTEALVRMKATLTQEAHASRRGADPAATEAREVA
jgi:MarR family transcriptional regulator, transcriptional regulator for hemolysin